MLLLCIILIQIQGQIFFSVVFTNQAIHIQQGFQVRIMLNQNTTYWYAYTEFQLADHI